MEKNNETLSVLRHSCSHIMAQAVQKLFPQAKLAIGPSTDSGFYYDFDLTDGYAFTQEDLVKIEEEMKNIIKQNLTFERFEVKDVKNTLISVLFIIYVITSLLFYYMYIFCFLLMLLIHYPIYMHNLLL